MTRMTGRVPDQSKAPEILSYVMEPYLKQTLKDLPVHLQIHKAHVIMLMEEGIIESEVASKLLGALLKLSQRKLEELPFQPTTDLYMNTENYLATIVGPEASGRMHLGRSRNDLYATATRMLARERILEILQSILELQRVFLNIARTHKDTVMLGYTHWQHAEPVTLGHWALAVFDALGRDVSRLWRSFEETNQSPLGAGALAGSSFRLNRDRTSILLGFDGVVENTMDAVVSRDFIASLVSICTILMTNVARISDTLIIWCTEEFRFADVPDTYAYTSSIMPQKKNPGLFLEVCRSWAGQVSGDLVAVLSTLKGTPFAHGRDTSYEINPPSWAALDKTIASLKILTGITRSMEFNVALMLSRAADSFSTMTELANALVRKKGLSFRTAHTVVGTMVRRALEAGMAPRMVTSDLLDGAAREVTGKAVEVTAAELSEILNPLSNVRLKAVRGGPQPVEVIRMIDARVQKLGKEEETLEGCRARLRQHSEELDRIVTNIIESLGPRA